MSEPTELLPERELPLSCPFCGSNEYKEDKWGFTIHHGNECYMTKAFDYTVRINFSRITYWNTRAHSPAQAEWLPIESAPKDGTEILIRESNGTHANVVYNTRKDMWTSPDGAYGYEPIHWMPLPAPPKETSK